MMKRKMGTLHNLEFKFPDFCDVCKKWAGTEEIETDVGNIVVCRKCFVKYCEESD